LPSLDLDLATLDGGGYAPSQFWGETHDGRDVYVRYRGGNFSVTVANEPGGTDETRILDMTIGPPLHGSISIGQLCHYFGITINGVRPPLPTAEECLQEGYSDLSGSTTFYDVWLSSGLDAQRRFLTAAIAAFPGTTLMQPILDDQFKTVGHCVCPTIESLTSDHSCMVLGGLTAEAVARLGQEPLLHHEAGHCVIALRTCGFQYPIRKYDNSEAERVHGATGKTIAVAGQVDDCLYGSFSLHAQFRNEDSERHAHLQKFDRLLDEFFPAYQVDCFDLRTGAREPEDSFIRHCDPDMVNWLDAGPDRWLGIWNKADGQNPRFAGSRPVRRA
jgi:hypothetical protein